LLIPVKMNADSGHLNTLGADTVLLNQVFTIDKTFLDFQID